MIFHVISQDVFNDFFLFIIIKYILDEFDIRKLIFIYILYVRIEKNISKTTDISNMNQIRFNMTNTLKFFSI